MAPDSTSDNTSSILSEDRVAIALLKEAGRQHDFRLMKLENKFDKLQENILARFDKLEQSADKSREENLKFQHTIIQELNKTLNLYEKINDRINKIEHDTKTSIETQDKQITGDLKKLQTEVEAISSLRLKLFGAISFICLLFAIFGRDLFKLITHT